MKDSSPQIQAGIKILGVLPGSLAEASGIRKGDRLHSINGHAVRDCIDYRYYESEQSLTLEIVRQEKRRHLSLTKGIDEDLGLELAEPRCRTCGNKCIFCFVRQMPPGLRRTLYVKDDDFRLSFLHGNYITLTNLGNADFKRIFAQRLSPLYVSVHATDEAVRRRILGNPKAPPVLPAISRLVSNGIRLHAQIVLCPGVNDGRILKRSLWDLIPFRDGVRSVAVVPVGLTRYRTGLTPLQKIDKAYATMLLDQIHAMQEESMQHFGEPWVFPSDEFYLTADRPFPSLETYGELPQVENGVGMVPQFLDSMERDIPRLPRHHPGTALLIGTGVLAFPFLRRLVRKISLRTGCRIDLVPIRNRFFGEPVTVSGLITGEDLIRTFSRHPDAGTLILPGHMLRPGKRVFLDGRTVRGVEEQLGRRLKFVAPEAKGFLSLFRGMKTIGSSRTERTET